MRILIAVDAITGGAGNVAQILATYYAKRGEDVYLMFSKKKTFDSKYDLNKITIIEAQQFFSNFSLLKTIIHYNKLIKEISPDIIISFLNTVSPPILLSQIMTSIPIIVSERSDPYNNTPQIKRKILRYISYKRASLITVQFDVFKKFNKNAYRKNKIVTIPNMILAPPNTKDYKIRSTKVSFVTFATLYHVKRLDLMIKLFSRIHKTCPNTELNIYGSGIDEEYLKALIKKLKLENVINLKGHVNNSHKYLSQNDIYLMTSVREGFPNALSEAMATGLPSISFKCHDGLSELIQNGINGYLIEEGDSDKFCELSEQLVINSSKRMKMGKAASEKIKKYDYDKIMSIWDKYVYSLLSKTIES